MDPRRRLLSVVVLVSWLLLVASSCSYFADANVVFKVQNKFRVNGTRKSLSAMRSHDARRHGRLLSALNLPLGGNGQPSDTGLYFAKIVIGTPSKDYYVQIDTGSDILWINCTGCDKCPTKSDLGVNLTLYDPKSSMTGDLVTCDQEFCTSTYGGPFPGCKPDLLCQYNVVYGDGSATTGYFVKDNVHLSQVTGSLQSSLMNTSVIFGCAAKQSGQLSSSSGALDGILGFGQSNSSMLSQLASAGKVRKAFSHCLDNVNGGGIFAVGELVQPKVNTTPLVPNQAHYNVNLKSVEVDGNVLQLSKDVFETGDGKGTIIDSGTALAYLPGEVYEKLMSKVKSRQPGLKLQTVEQIFTCFQYNGSIDDGFPTVKFHFEDSLSLAVYPHDYFFPIKEDEWCFGWMNSGDGNGITLLGDLVLSNKVVFYDLENQSIGWVEYNCSSRIEVSGEVYSVNAQDVNAPPTQDVNAPPTLVNRSRSPNPYLWGYNAQRSRITCT